MTPGMWYGMTHGMTYGLWHGMKPGMKHGMVHGLWHGMKPGMGYRTEKGEGEWLLLPPETNTVGYLFLYREYLCGVQYFSVAVQ